MVITRGGITRRHSACWSCIRDDVAISRFDFLWTAKRRGKNTKLFYLTLGKRVEKLFVVFSVLDSMRPCWLRLVVAAAVVVWCRVEPARQTNGNVVYCASPTMRTNAYAFGNRQSSWNPYIVCFLFIVWRRKYSFFHNFSSFFLSSLRLFNLADVHMFSTKH